ncbi:MAG TPA: PP2C family protein-serine/threonine phosphatase [Thermoanaerobaculia bacterium]|nr:PP2C family protein-serine/threonine phosphatase [Thermoanaerobaculia bacterium]
MSRRASKTKRKRKRGTSVFDDARSFASRYAEGVRPGELRSILARQASEAYDVITRDQSLENEPKRGLRRFFFRARILFLGMSFKLTPPRRVLFGASVVAIILGLLGSQARYDGARVSVSIDFSGFWLLLAISGLLFLLGLELVDRIRVRDEIEVARHLQRELLPEQAPKLPGWSFAHSYRTANDIGGDYYDFLPLSNGRLAMVIGDASGHGMAAGLLMAIANASLKTAVDLDPDPVAVLALINRALIRTGDRHSFMTMLFGLLDTSAGRLDFASAGHPFPLLRRADGRVEEVGSGALPLGIRAKLTLKPDHVVLAPGDALVLYSDGVPEAMSPTEDSFGYERLRAAVAVGGSAEEMQKRLLSTLAAHLGVASLEEARLTDDITIVVIEHRKI